MTRPDDAEDRLRALLQDTADLVVPRGDGLARIQARVRPHRGLRRVLAPALGLATVVALASVGAYAAQVTRPDTPTPPAVADSPEPVPSGGCTGLCTEPRPSPTPAATPVETAAGTPIWPFTAVPAPTDRLPDWAVDAGEVAGRFVDVFLDLPGSVPSDPEIAEEEGVALVRLLVSGREAGVVRLIRLGSPGHPWSVTGVTAPGLDMAAPAEVSSPQQVSGRVDGADQSVRVQLVTARPGTSARVRIAEGFAPAGAERPWQTELTWTDDEWEVGALAASTADGNGVLLHVHVSAVRLAAEARPPAAGAAFVATERGRVVLVDATSGRRTRQLSFPSEGRTDSQPTRGGRDAVVFVRSSADGCTDTQLVRVGISDGPAGVTVRREGFRLTAPSMSEDGRWLAWVQNPCGAGDPAVVLRGPDAVERTFTPSGEVSELDVSDDGTVVVTDERGVRVASGQRWPGTELQAGPSCRLTSAARDGDEVVAFELCEDGVQQVRYALDGRRLGAGPGLDPLTAVRTTAVVGGRVLVWTGEQGVIAEVVDGERLRVVRSGDGCASDQQPEGCFSFPDW